MSLQFISQKSRFKFFLLFLTKKYENIFGSISFQLSKGKIKVVSKNLSQRSQISFTFSKEFLTFDILRLNFETLNWTLRKLWSMFFETSQTYSRQNKILKNYFVWFIFIWIEVISNTLKGFDYNYTEKIWFLERNGVYMIKSSFFLSYSRYELALNV